MGCNYVPFDYGERINSWRVPFDKDMPSELTDREKREKIYHGLIDMISEDMSKNDALLAKHGVRQEQWPAKRIFEYILELIPPQDLFDFARHEPPPPHDVFMAAARVYDHVCYDEALKLLAQPSVIELTPADEQAADMRAKVDVRDLAQGKAKAEAEAKELRARVAELEAKLEKALEK